MSFQDKDIARILAEKLLDHPENEWASLIDEWSQGDDQLKKKIQAHADANRNARDFVEELQKKVYSLAKSTFETGIHEPEQIEGYHIIKKLGSGASAVVYLVEDPSGQKAALKLLRGSAIDTHFRQRFDSERYILSRLNHNNIARMIEGGISEKGIPYVVMEYVDGTPIDVWCNKNKLSVRKRIKLFQDVCRAVHYAHQNLLVHRDIKPEHVLITTSGEIKLIDFGIAKLLEPDESEFQALHTHTGIRVMTPEFASPEQVRGETVTTASDIYSLGVLLYLLLTGKHPYRFKTTSMLEVERLVCEQEPERPSDSVMGDSADSEQSRLQKVIKGDLDRIILMAMRKEAGLRYSSAQSLADDLENYLKNEPVIARAPTIRYRVDKFIRRHKIPVVAAIFALIALSAGLAGTLWQAKQAQQNAEIAEIQAQRAEQVATFLAEMFQESDPTKANDGTITAREMLDKGFEKVQAELAEQPAVKAQMLGIIGKVYQNLGLFDQSLAALEESVDLFREVGESSTQYISSLLELGNIQYRRGQLDLAEVTIEEVLELNTAYYGPDHPEVASVMNTLALIYEGNGNFEAAIATIRQVIDIRRIQSEPGHNLAANLNNLAIMLHRTGELEESDLLFREAVEVVEDIWGDNHPYMAFTLNGYAGLHQQRGLYAEAETDLLRALEIGRSVFPETHPFIAVVLHNLGKLFEETGDGSNAEFYYRSGLDLRRSSLPAGHPDIASSLDGLALLLIETERADEAVPLLREALEIRRNSYQEDDWRIAQVEAHLGRSLLKLDRFREAEELLVKSYEALKNSRGEDDLHTKNVQSDLEELQSVLFRDHADPF